MATLTRGVPCDDSRIADEMGIRCRPASETLSDALCWMYEQGIVERRHVRALLP